MTEDDKTKHLERVKALLDANDRVRVIERQGVEERPGRHGERDLVVNGVTYLLIAVGQETEVERLAVGLLGSAIKKSSQSW